MPLSRRSPRNVRFGPSDRGASLISDDSTTRGGTPFASSSESESAEGTTTTTPASFAARSWDGENDVDDRGGGEMTVVGLGKPLDETMQ